MDRKALVDHAHRIVIKLGTAVLMRDEGGLALGRLYSFVESIADLKKAGKEVLLVSSGAIGLGAQRLNLTQRPKLLPIKQACAAIGQGRLMAIYSDAFEQFGITTAQVLLTEEDFSNRRRYLNLRSTITQLLELGVLPIINENDTVSTVELELDKDKGAATHKKVNFGDNDKLSALVASKVEAELLIILTDVEGLYTADPRVDTDAKLIPEVTNLDEIIDDLDLGSNGSSDSAPSSKVGRGGMKTKLAAAKVATQSGCATIIAGGKVTGIVDRLFHGETVGTVFLPKGGLKGKQRWIAFATTVKAAVVVNAGAQDALVKKKASLLPAGVIEVRDIFERGDVVSILDPNGHEFARGIVNYSSVEAKKISGMHSDAIDEVIEHRNYDALVTRNNIVFLD